MSKKLREVFVDNSLFNLVMGSGTPIVTLHGGLGYDHTLFRPWLDPLADSAQLIYNDFRGNGRSRVPNDPAAWRPERLAADIECLRRELNLGRIVLLAHSVGALVAVTFARNYPDSTTGLILCSGAPAMDFMAEANAEIARRATPEQMKAVGRLFTSPDLDDESFRETVLDLLPLYFVRVPEETRDILGNQTRFSARAWTWFRDHVLFSYNCLPWLKEVSAPTLVVVGGEDFLAPVGPCGKRWVEHMPKAELQVIPDTGHLPFSEAPDKFLTLVRSWLAGLGA